MSNITELYPKWNETINKLYKLYVKIKNKQKLTKKEAIIKIKRSLKNYAKRRFSNKIQAEFFYKNMIKDLEDKIANPN